MYKPITKVGIDGDDWLINNEPTYKGRMFDYIRVEGLLLNSRMANGIFDDNNPFTRNLWAYPDTEVWDPQRNTDELVRMFPIYWKYGLRALSINIQGGSPLGYYRDEDLWIRELVNRVQRYNPSATASDIWNGLTGKEVQPWNTGGLESSGKIIPEAQKRLRQVIEGADKAGLIVCLGIFYFGQDNRISGETGIRSSVKSTCEWVLDSGYTNVIIEINNETDIPKYSHEILGPARIHELIQEAKEFCKDGSRLLVGTSFTRRQLPTRGVVDSSDFILLHGNGVDVSGGIRRMVNGVRGIDSYKGQPIVFNEDDHFDFRSRNNNFREALECRASWGYFDPGDAANGGFAYGDYINGYQNPPINWDINTTRKKEFFDFVSNITGSANK